MPLPAEPGRGAARQFGKQRRRRYSV